MYVIKYKANKGIVVVVLLGLHAKKYKKLRIFNSFYLLDSCNQSLK